MESPLCLRELTPQDEAAFWKGLFSFPEEQREWFSFEWEEGRTYAEILDGIARTQSGVDLPPTRVPATTLYGFVGDEIVGRINIRHRLNEFLKMRGGHVGYAVLPHHRRKGYATEMFRQALPVMRNLGLTEVLVTCSDTNEPSWKIIEHFGGRLESKPWDDYYQEIIRRYWVTV